MVLQQQFYCLNTPERQALGQFTKETSVPNGVMCSSYLQEDCTSLQCLLEPILNERCEGCDLVAGAAAMVEASLIDTDKVFHSWGDSLQDDAFQQLVTYA